MIPIFVEEPITYREIQVPQHVVQHCAEFTGIDPYSELNLHDDLRLTDCYWYGMNYYELKPPPGW